MLRKKLQKISRIILKKKNLGYCPVCRKKTLFVEYDTWLRDNYKCVRCNSLPRNRALVDIMDTWIPGWKDMIIHESSPNKPWYFMEACPGYTYSHFLPGVTAGDYRDNVRCEDLSKLTFPDNSIDIFITQDVLEHLIRPFDGLREIKRVLKPGGAHVFTTPLYHGLKKTRARTNMENNQLVYIEPPVYHGNPIDKKGSLVTYDWGLDFTGLIFGETSMTTTVYLQKDRKKGLDSLFQEVFVSIKQ
jgi:SAM-dependent methyltransferase